jgi:hypothetical protein
MVIFDTFKQFPQSELAIHTPTTPTVAKVCKTTSTVSIISSHEDTLIPPYIFSLTIAKVSIEFWKN